MKQSFVLSLIMALCSMFCCTPSLFAQRQGTDEYFKLGPDSLPQEGVPHGKVEGPFVLPSKVFEGTQHTYWTYVPAQYDPEKPASLMIFQDGHAFLNENGSARTTNVIDNLTFRREIPVMITVFINPGRRPDQEEPNGRQWEMAQPIEVKNTTHWMTATLESLLMS